MQGHHAVQKGKLVYLPSDIVQRKHIFLKQPEVPFEGGDRSTGIQILTQAKALFAKKMPVPIVLSRLTFFHFPYPSISAFTSTSRLSL